MKNLIIIGNGFDLAHGLKTNYSDFKTDIKNHPEKYGIQMSFDNYLLKSLLKDDNELWSDIEATYFDILVNFDNKSHLRKYYHPIETYKSIKLLNDDFEKIKDFLSIYLFEQEQKFKSINNYQKIFNEFNNKDTVIVNFNYTKTVKHYINERKIKLIHIHGELNKENNPIIFGFAANHEESKKLLIENDNNYVRNIKKFNYLFTNNESLLKKHLQSDEYNVFILGHSCGISDRLILSQIFNSKNIHEIIPFYHLNMNGYFNTMVNVDRIIDDYSKSEKDKKSFNKLLSFPRSYKMPQRDNDINLVGYLNKILEKKLPKEKHLEDQRKNWDSIDPR
jgi:hypothetical protein